MSESAGAGRRTAGEHPDAAQRVRRAREHVGVGVGAGQRGVDDGEQHEHPQHVGDGAGQALPRHAVRRRRETGGVRRPVGHGGRVGREQEQRPDEDRGEHHRARHVAPRLLGLFRQGRGRLEAGEGQQRAYGPAPRRSCP